MGEVQGFAGMSWGILVTLCFVALYLAGRRLPGEIRRRREAEMKHRKLHQVVECTRAAIIVTDVDGNVEYVNPRFCEMTGYRFGEIVGQNPRILKSGTQSRETYEALWRTIQCGVEWCGELQNKRKDGSLYWVDVRIKALRDAGGSITRFIGVEEDITSRVAAEKQLRESEQQFRAVAESANDAIVSIDELGSVRYWNGAAKRIFGYRADEMIGKPVTSIMPESYRDAHARSLDRLRDGSPAHLLGHTVEVRGLHRDGHELPVELSLSDSHVGERKCYTAIIRDISARKSTEEDLRLASAVFESAAEAIMVTDADKNIRTVNPAFRRVTGYDTQDVVGRNATMLMAEERAGKFVSSLWQSAAETGNWQGEIWNRRGDGRVYPAWLSLSAIGTDDTARQSFVALFSDITERKRAEDRMRHQANFDPLTGLPNRQLFHDRLSRALAAAMRNGTSVGLLFIDLDRFKQVNDTLGHHAGDEVLREAARRLTNSVRKSDTVARLAGDEFTVIVTDTTQGSDTEPVASTILSAFSKPFMVDDNELAVPASIGIAVYPGDGRDAQTLVRNADTAMYRAKTSGSNLYRFFAPEMNAEATQRAAARSALSRAFENGELEVHYQPVFDLASNEIRYAEALVRWRRPDGQLITAAEFVPVAERTRLIVPIGDWVLSAACRQWSQWRGMGLQVPPIAINLSRRQLLGVGRHYALRRLLAENNLPANMLILEVSERILVDRADECVSVLRQIRDLGVGIAIDDYGLHDSPLRALRRCPADWLKIDHTLVPNVIDSIEQTADADAIIALGKTLGLTVVAEGVESKVLADFLSSRGCPAAQGRFLCPPVPAEDYQRLLQDGRPGEAHGRPDMDPRRMHG